MRMKNESFYRQKIERLLLRADRAQSADTLLAGMKIKKADRPAALLALQRMEAEGRITRNKKGKYALSAAQGKREMCIRDSPQGQPSSQGGAAL